jgi:hypothetical protein
MAKKKSDSHKEKFKRIGNECRAEVAKSGAAPMSKAMWSKWGACLRKKWK